MDQNQTPGGRPAPKKPCFANRFLDDPNIEQTLLMDATNTSEHPPTGGNSLGDGGAKFAPSSLFAAPPADPNGTRNDFDDSLADLTCSFKPSSALFGAQQSPFPQPKPADVLVAEISVLELEKTQEVTLPFLPDVDVQSVVFEAIELEIGATGADQTAELSEKLTMIEFLCAEHVTALVKKDPTVAKKTDLVESVRDCVRSLVALGRNASKAKFEAVQAKDRADYDCMMNLEREKTKNIAQEQQLLRSRIAELEDEKQRMEETCTEFQNQIKRLEQLADEADTLEHELIKTRVEKKKLAAQLDAALKK
ncbi:hypothetical protein M3Y99_01363600 [Aphelenchoides fujianensis]|nr:hypothetical protein M3Y99_01363600 [Aphelenchoides fujianensis]